MTGLLVDRYNSGNGRLHRATGLLYTFLNGRSMVIFSDRVKAVDVEVNACVHETGRVKLA